MRVSSAELASYRDTLREQVCSACFATGYGAACKVGEGGVCPIDLYLPEIVEAVLSTPRSDRIADYVPSIRTKVCAHCVNQDERGACAARDLAVCGLDSLLLLLVEAVEEVYDREHGATATPPKTGVVNDRACLVAH